MEIPSEERKRLHTLRSYEVLDTQPEERFDRVARLAAQTIGASMAAVAFVDADRLFFKSHYGFAASEGPREGSYCARAIRQPEPLVVHDALDDERFRDCPPCMGGRAVRFYAGVPLQGADGYRIGTLCVFDHVPNAPTTAQIDLLVELAAIVVDELEANRRNRIEAQRIRDERNRFRALVEASAQVVWVARATGEISEITPMWHQLTGQTLQEVQRGGWARVVHPEEGVPLLPLWRNAVRDKRIFESSFRLRMRSGEYRWFSVRAVPIINADGSLREYVGRFADIHDQRMARERLLEGAERLRLAFEASRMGMWELDLKTGDVHLSPEAFELLGITESTFDVEAWNRLEYIHPDDREAVRANSCQVLSTPAFELAFEHRTRYPEGQERWLRSVSRVYRDEKGLPTRLVGTLVDITNAKAYEAGLVEAKERAEEMMRLKDAFLANISHEIRTPLTAILGFTDLLRTEAPPQLRDYAEMIEVGGRRLNETLVSILELAQLNAGTLLMTPAVIDVAPLVRDVAGQFAGEAKRRQLSLVVETDTSLPPVRADRYGFVRTLEHLISNALKFTESGHVAVEMKHAAEAVEIVVRDTGCGISADFMPHLFTDFRQESTGLSRSHEGAGLGLAIAARLVRGMGGELKVESEVGSGSAFTIRLPLDAPDSRG